jgi:putative spermidine/putrescine transport system substrate-binding protein
MWVRSALALTVVLVLAGCGGDDSSSKSGGGGGGDGELKGAVAVNNSGGDLLSVYKSDWWGPLGEKTGLSVKPSAPADFTKLVSQVESGNVIWDLTEIEVGGQYLEAVDKGYLEPMDKAKLDKYMKEFGAENGVDDLLPDSVESNGVWLTVYATVLMYDKRKFPDGGPQPTSLADLWDTEKFPGKRCIHSQAIYNLDIALAADGVDADSMYPLDVDRALKKLDGLKGNVAKFWREGTEPIQLVSSGECVMSTVWNGRPFAAEVLEGIDYFGVAWDGGIRHISRWVIPKGAPNVEGAYAALAYHMLPEVGAALANKTAYPNVNKNTPGQTDEAAQKYLATTEENFAGLVGQDDQWWVDNGKAAEDKYLKWQRGA